MGINEQKRIPCLKCFRSEKHCLCKHIEPFNTNTHFILLMHPVEAYKMKTGTGRLSHVALKNSEIIVGVDFSNHKRVNEIIQDQLIFPTVLYPGDDSINISKGDLSLNSINNKKLYVFIIDSTWYYSKKILRLSKNLQTLPKISFNTEYRSQFIFKKQPSKECLSTIESIFYFLEESEKFKLESVGEKKNTLIKVFKKMVDFQLECESDPNRSSYKSKKSKRLKN